MSDCANGGRSPRKWDGVEWRTLSDGTEVHVAGGADVCEELVFFDDPSEPPLRRVFDRRGLTVSHVVVGGVRFEPAGRAEEGAL